jgi:hypothetical protein
MSGGSDAEGQEEKGIQQIMHHGVEPTVWNSKPKLLELCMLDLVTCP